MKDSKKKPNKKKPNNQVMVYVAGSKRSFRCDCGCNVFTKHQNNKMICNSCGTSYTGEK